MYKPKANPNRNPLSHWQKHHILHKIDLVFLLSPTVLQSSYVTIHKMSSQNWFSICLHFLLCSYRSSWCGHHQHPPCSEPFTSDSLWSLGLLLPDPSEEHHLWESPILCSEYQSAHVGLGGTRVTWSCEHGVRLCNQEDILSPDLLRTAKAKLYLSYLPHI